MGDPIPPGERQVCRQQGAVFDPIRGLSLFRWPGGYRILQSRGQEFRTPPIRGGRNSVPLPWKVSGILYPSIGGVRNSIPLPRGHPLSSYIIIIYQICLNFVQYFKRTWQTPHDARILKINCIQSRESVPEHQANKHAFWQALHSKLAKLSSVVSIDSVDCIGLGMQCLGFWGAKLENYLE